MEYTPKSTPHTPLLEECLRTLRDQERSLHARGILHAGIFGSVARGEDDEKSDIDILIDIESDASFDILDLVQLQRELGEVFDRSVDVISAESLKSPKHDRILNETINAF